MTTDIFPKIKKREVLFHDMQEDEATLFTVDLNPECVRLGVTVSTAVWSTDAGNAAVSGDSLSSNVATALITVPDIERTQVKVVLTLSDSQILNQFIQINVADPIVDLFPPIWGLP